MNLVGYRSFRPWWLGWLITAAIAGWLLDIALLTELFFRA